MTWCSQSFCFCFCLKSSTFTRLCLSAGFLTQFPQVYGVPYYSHTIVWPNYFSLSSLLLIPYFCWRWQYAQVKTKQHKTSQPSLQLGGHVIPQRGGFSGKAFRRERFGWLGLVVFAFSLFLLPFWNFNVMVRASVVISSAWGKGREKSEKLWPSHLWATDSTKQLLPSRRCVNLLWALLFLV